MPDRKAISSNERLALEAAPSSSSQALTSRKARKADSKSKTAYDTDESEVEVEYDEYSEDEDPEPAQRRKQIGYRAQDEQMSNALVPRSRTGGEVIRRETDDRDRGKSAQTAATLRHTEKSDTRGAKKPKALEGGTPARRKQIEGVQVDDDTDIGALVPIKRVTGEIAKRDGATRIKSSSEPTKSSSTRSQEGRSTGGGQAKPKEIAYEEKPSRIRIGYTGIDEISDSDEETISSSALVSRKFEGEISNNKSDEKRASRTSAPTGNAKPSRNKDDSRTKVKAIEYASGATKRKELMYHAARTSENEEDCPGEDSRRPKNDARTMHSEAGPLVRKKRDSEPASKRHLSPVPERKHRKRKAMDSRATEAPKEGRERKGLDAAPVVKEKKTKPAARKQAEDTETPAEKPVSKPQPKPHPRRAREPEPEPEFESAFQSDEIPVPESKSQAPEDEGEHEEIDFDHADDAVEAAIDSATRRYHKEMEEYKTRMAQWDRDNEERRAVDAALTMRAWSPSPESERRERRQRSPTPEPDDRSLARRRHTPSVDAEDRKLARRQHRDVQRSRRYEDDEWSEEDVRPRKQEVVKEKKKKPVKKQSIKINLSNVNNVTL